MATVLRYGPADRGQPLSLEEFLHGRYEEGYRYELIHGRLAVSPAPNLPHSWQKRYVYFRLSRYSESHPEIINFVADDVRVFVPDEPDATAPEPDTAAYRGFPLERMPHVAWHEVSPLVTVEVSGEDESAEKDLVRNVELYRRVPSIQEYWVFDLRDDPARPTLTVFRRNGDQWRELRFGPDQTYTTDLLPGFTLPVSPQAPLA
jgi:Uma2 family endonuclease